jgi:hypothetical protein
MVDDSGVTVVIVLRWGKAEEKDGEEEKDINRDQVVLGRIEMFRDRQDVTSRGTALLFQASVGLTWALFFSLLLELKTAYIACDLLYVAV